jgi:hypothetical protein
MTSFLQPSYILSIQQLGQESSEPLWLSRGSDNRENVVDTCLTEGWRLVQQLQERKEPNDYFLISS